MLTTRVRFNNLKPIIDHLQFVDKKTGPALYAELGTIIYMDKHDDIPGGIINECSGLIGTLKEDYPEGFMLGGAEVFISPKRKGRGLNSGIQQIDDSPFTHYAESIEEGMSKVDINFSLDDDNLE